MGKEYLTTRYPGNRSFGSDYDCGRVTAGWGYLEPGNLSTVISKRNTVGESKHPQV